MKIIFNYELIITSCRKLGKIKDLPTTSKEENSKANYLTFYSAIQQTQFSTLSPLTRTELSIGSFILLLFSLLVLSIKANAQNVGIGTAVPNNTLEIKSLAPATSGLRFTNLNLNSLPSLANGVGLSVDVNGDVILVPSVSTTPWLLTGNANATASSFLGTTNAVDLVFKTANTEYMRMLSSNGNVGIGTAVPQTLLHIYSTTSDNQFAIQTSASNLAAGMRIYAGANGMILGMSSWPDAWTIGSIIGDAVLNNSVATGGIAFGINNYAKMYLNATGDFGIGTTTPAFKLDVAGSTNCVSNTWTSDRRKKQNIQPLNVSALAIINQLKPVTYEWKQVLDNGMKGTQMGFIAQELEQILPSMVVTINDKEQSKTVKYNELLPIYAKAIQELQEQIEALKKEIELLKKK